MAKKIFILGAIILIGSFAAWVLVRDSSLPIVGFWKLEKEFEWNASKQEWIFRENETPYFTEFRENDDDFCIKQAEGQDEFIHVLPSNGCFFVHDGVLESQPPQGTFGKMFYEWNILGGKLELVTIYQSADAKETSRNKSINVPATYEEASLSDPEAWPPGEG